MYMYIYILYIYYIYIIYNIYIHTYFVRPLRKNKSHEVQSFMKRMAQKKKLKTTFGSDKL